MTPEEARDRAKALVADMYAVSASADADRHAIADVANALLAAVAAERERCAKLAEAEGPCCMNQQCHETVAERIRKSN